MGTWVVFSIMMSRSLPFGRPAARLAAVGGRVRFPDEVGLDEDKLVAVRVLEGSRDPPRLLDGLRVVAHLEVDPLGSQRLEVLAAVGRGERDLVAARAGFRAEAEVHLRLPFHEDEFELLPFGGDGEPTRPAGLLVVGALLEPQRPRE